MLRDNSKFWCLGKCWNRDSDFGIVVQFLRQWMGMFWKPRFGKTWYGFVWIWTL